MSGAPNTTALAALLASHPEECAAVVAVLSSYGGTNALVIADAMREDRTPLSVERIGDILDAMTSADVCLRGREGRRWIYAVEHKERRAIARMGAAAWLRARVAPTLNASPRERELRSSARLFALAAEVWASHIPEPRKTDARWFVRSALPESARRYRDALEDLAAMGERMIDVDAEVAAVWGAGAPTKGEQR